MCSKEISKGGVLTVRFTKLLVRVLPAGMLPRDLSSHRLPFMANGGFRNYASHGSQTDDFVNSSVNGQLQTPPPPRMVGKRAARILLEFFLVVGKICPKKY